jgi:hypothetical protein
MNLFKVEFSEDAEGNEILFCWEHKDGYETLRSIYEWAEQQPDVRCAIQVPNEQTASAMIEHGRETQESLEDFTFEKRGLIITLQSV